MNSTLSGIIYLRRLITSVYEKDPGKIYVPEGQVEVVMAAFVLSPNKSVRRATQ